MCYFPNKDSELKGSTSGQKIGTEDTPGSPGSAAAGLPRDAGIPLHSSNMLCICIDRAWCLRHSAAVSPILRFALVIYCVLAPPMHLVQYIYQHFGDFCIRFESETQL